eukprot:SAG22_NODE_490_length_9834_cov_7.723780_7_plen_98_part_00
MDRAGLLLRSDGSGRYNYTREANTVLAAVTTKPEPQNMFTPPPHTVVRFDPGTAYTDPSYFLPAFYTAWARQTDHTPAHWAEAAGKQGRQRACCHIS